jgi:hypothetical protein
MSKHGTRSKYVNEKCRCKACTKANRDWQRPYWRAKVAKERGGS